MKLFNRFSKNKKNITAKSKDKMLLGQAKKEPLKIIDQGKHLNVSIRGLTIFSHSASAPFISVSRGKFSLKQKGIKAVVDEYDRKTIKLIDYEVKKENVDTVIHFSNKGYEVKVILEENTKGLKISFESNNNFEIIKFNFKRKTGEYLLGLGETKADNLIDLEVNSYPLYNANEDGLLLKSVLKDSLNRNEKHTPSISISNTLLSSEKYLMQVEHPLRVKYDFKKEITSITLGSTPKSISFIFGNEFNDIYKTLNTLRPNNQQVPERLQKGIAISESKEKLEKTLKLLFDEKVGASVTIIKDSNWKDEELKSLDTIATRYGHRLILRTTPYVSRENEDFKELSAKGFFVLSKNSEVYLERIEGKAQAFIDLTNPKAVKYYQEKLSKALKWRKIMGFLAECKYPFPLNCLSSLNAEELRANWITTYHKIVREVIDEKQDGVLLLRGVNSHSAEYGIVLTEEKHADSSSDFGLKSVLPSVISLGASGNGLVLSEIGGEINRLRIKCDDETFKDWIRLGALFPVMIFGSNCIKQLIKHKQFLKRVMEEREQIIPFISMQLSLIKNSIPPVMPEWFYLEEKEMNKKENTISDNEENSEYFQIAPINENEEEDIYFSEKMKITFTENSFYVSVKRGTSWEKIRL